MDSAIGNLHFEQCVDCVSGSNSFNRLLLLCICSDNTQLIGHIWISPQIFLGGINFVRSLCLDFEGGI